MRKLLFNFLLALAALPALAQHKDPWSGKKAAVVITYDDAIDQHLDNAAPVLDSLGIKASFYITAASASVQTRLNEWRQLAVNGHELGNHTIYHPCIGGTGREWVPKDYDLRSYSVQRMVDEIRMTNIFLQALDGKTKRTYAYTCGDMMINDSAYFESLKPEFVAARGVRAQLQSPDSVDLYNVDCFVVNNHSADEMISWVKKASEQGALLVVLFHGVGGGNGLDVSIDAHRKFLQYLKSRESELLITTLVDAGERIRERKQKSKTNNQ
ncbi:MAG: polysaccharide deacetylase family protein [Chitinophagaceae bacterium]